MLGTLLGAYLLYRLRELLAVLFGAIIFASAIRPLVATLHRRGMRREVAILATYAAMLSGVAGLLIVTVPPLVRLGIDFFSDGLLTETARSLAVKLALFGWDKFRVMLPVFTLPEQLRGLVDEAGNTAQRRAWPLMQSVGLILGELVLGLVMGFYWLTGREQILGALLQRCSPKDRTRIEQIWNEIEYRLGAYIRGQAILMSFVGIAAFVGLFVLGVPHALALAVVAGLTDIVPWIGPVIGGAPAVMVGFTISPVTGLLVSAWYLMIQQIEAHVLMPKVMERNVGLKPLAVILAFVAGVQLSGVVGALIAIPIAGALQVIVWHLWPADETDPDVSEEGQPQEQEKKQIPSIPGGSTQARIKNI